MAESGDIDKGVLDSETSTENELVDSGKTPKATTRQKPREKRKAGSPAEKIGAIKRVNSDPDLSQIKKKNAPFSEIILQTFKDEYESFINGVTPIITSMIAPVVNAAVKTAVQTSIDEMRSTVVEELIVSNRSLQESVKKQMDFIEAQQILMEKQANELKVKSEKIAGLESKVKALTQQVEKLSVGVNEVEQYSRRNSVRVSNYTYSPTLSETALTEKLVCFLNENVLSSETKISSADIDRCHPVGPPNEKGNRQIIVKFKNYSDKQRVFAGKKKLKGNTNRTFITEDLTKHNYELVKHLNFLKRGKTIDSFWTINGHVFAKGSADGTPIRISSEGDIESKLS